MDVQKYLQRIRYNATPGVNHESLAALHKAHLFAVPFEDLDIHLGNRFDLQPENVFSKVVNRNRGGFCYELNLLFHNLLTSIGFKSRILAARVYDSEGQLGPPFDHMCLLVQADGDYLADVGFGDFFLTPMRLGSQVHFDGRNYFRIVSAGRGAFEVEMSGDGTTFTKKYRFTLDLAKPSDFEAPCLEKQTDPQSHFVRNIICTRPTDTGRVTIFNNKLIRHVEGERREESFDPSELKDRIQSAFGITVS